ncbi:ankyrin repeat and MYND domain-containing protein 1 isoform X5 [Gorilla gorilla gorilla]|uniref:ankyrin repeat and MYND domain-containing protein 1 isoform X5 n=1 Tax=Gorilla gorilla gorilla TaxID=9595 RepID=UPI0024456290|nr:ankyrin repeat and MYND domain-containing protein 1 isoform X6 [Gorilla gorilla gorilla]
MEGAHASLSLEDEVSGAGSPQRPLEGKGGETPAAEEPGSLKNYAVFATRDVSAAPEKEEEEAEGPLRAQDLRESYIQLIQGVQEWQDGCMYHGEFGLNMKLGYGKFSWPTGESYHGQFYRDHCHGLGTYMWPDGSSFTGTFYLSHREGYGTMYMKTRLFQGLYKADQRFGPGVETYPDGSQDVGLWFREQLIKLCTQIPSGFSLLRYPEFSSFITHSPARISLSEEEKTEWGLQEGQDPFFYDYKRFLLNDNLTLPPEMYVYSTNSDHLPMTSSFRKELDARIFLNEIPPFVEDGEPWFIINETPLLVKIQKQTYKFRNKPAHTSWNMGAILEGKRSSFAPCGPKERLSMEMILKAEEGNHDWICRILKDNFASADVADAKGYTVLAAAATHCHNNIVNLLLDCGADVNKCSDEGLTALSMCFLLYYPAQSFKPNVAERTIPEPQEPPKFPVVPILSSSFMDTNLESLYYEVNVPSQGSYELRPLPTPPPLPHVSGSQESGHFQDTGQCGESVDHRSSSLKGDSPLVKGSLGHVKSGLEDVLGNTDRGSLCSAETNFESNVCVCNFSIKLSQAMLERSAQSHSLLKMASPSPCTSSFDKGTMRRMALSMIERRKRWRTMKLLLRRGADPNLCCVPMQVLFLAVKAGDMDGVRLLLEHGARTDICFPPQLRTLTPLHIAAALPGEEGVQIVELLLHAITDVDAKASDEDDTYKPGKLDLLPSSLKLSNEPGPPQAYYSTDTALPEEGGRTALHVACEREDDNKGARDIVRLLLSHGANPNLLWSGHSPLSLSIASGNELVVKELLTQGADPNLPLTKGLGSALCVACDLTYEHQRNMDSKLALIDRLISHGADILKPVMLRQGEEEAVGTAVDYGYFRFFQLYITRADRGPRSPRVTAAVRGGPGTLWRPWCCAAGPEDCPLPLPHADAGRARDVPGAEAAPGVHGLAATAGCLCQGEPVGPHVAVPVQESGADPQPQDEEEGPQPAQGPGCEGAGANSLLQVLLPVWPLHRGPPLALPSLLRDPDLQQVLQDQGLDRVPQEGLQGPGGHRDTTGASFQEERRISVKQQLHVRGLGRTQDCVGFLPA